jgi:hypothetical protein
VQLLFFVKNYNVTIKTHAEVLVFKGPLCLRNAIIFISQNVNFCYLVTVSKTLLICHTDELTFTSVAILANGIILVN